MDQNNEAVKQEATEQELQEAAGGNIIDSAICYFAGHVWKNVVKNFHPGFIYQKKVCERCGKYGYFLLNRSTGELIREISEQEFNDHPIVLR